MNLKPLMVYTDSLIENREVTPKDQNDVTYGVFENNTTDLAGFLALETGFRGDYSVGFVVAGSVQPI